MKKTLAFILGIALLFAAMPSALAANARAGTASQYYWNSPEQTLAIENSDPMLPSPGTTNLLLTQAGNTKTINSQVYGIVGFYMCGDFAAYYAKNAKGADKWFTYNLKSGTQKEYAYDFLSPFWADGKYIYSTTGGKRVYDYNVFRFDPKTGKKAKLASVYGMPIGYVGKQLIALDFYHDQLRYYESSKLVKKIPADMLSGFIVQETIYLVFSDGIYRVDGEKLTKVIEGYMAAQACFNGGIFVYHSGGDYPRDAYLITPGKVQKVGTAKDKAAMDKLQTEVIALCKVK